MPKTTYYGKRIPKEKFYSHLEVSATVKRSFVDDVDYFVWCHKLSKNTLNLAAGEKIKEIAIFDVYLKHEECSRCIFDVIDKNVAVYVVYVLHYGERVCINVAHKEPTANNGFRVVERFESDWVDATEAQLRIEGLDLDKVFENFVRQVAGVVLQTTPSESLTQDIERQKQHNKRMRQIATLEAKRRNEKQFNRQIELSAEIKKLKEQI
ncbi:MAG: DUF4391 domain-containing protein [Oscillospiraceae bacterium]